MTARSLRWTALPVAVAIIITAMLIYGYGTRWCFCAITTAEPPVELSPFVQRLMMMGLLPVNLAARWLNSVLPLGLVPLQGLVILGLLAWFLAVLALLNAIALAARVRVGRGIRLAGRESVRLRHLLMGVCILLVAAMAFGAMQRRAWLSEAERVFAATMTAAGTGRPLPPGVDFSMYARRGDDFHPTTPQGRFETRVDPDKVGHHFPDQFVVPYVYGGMMRFESGTFYEFDVYPNEHGWSIHLFQRFPRFRRE